MNGVLSALTVSPDEWICEVGNVTQVIYHPLIAELIKCMF